MSEDTTQSNEVTDTVEVTQSPAEALAALKARADMLGVQYHPSIGYEKLSEKVAAALASTEPVTPQNPDPAPSETSAEAQEAPVAPKVETENERRARFKREALKLVRIKVVCMNPAKKEWEGELFTCGNSVIGSVTKYVPFNNDEGWHVPQIILNMIQARECQIFTTVRDARGNATRKAKMIKEFAVEIMDQLTDEELHELALRQAASKSIDN